jgi:hypothetical protein
MVEPYEVWWHPHSRVTGRVVAWISAFGVQIAGDSREQLEQQITIKSRGGDPACGIRWPRTRS